MPRIQKLGMSFGIWIEPEMVSEDIRVDPQQQPVVLQLGALHSGQKVAAVYQRSPIANTVVLAGLPFTEDNKGIVATCTVLPSARASRV